MRGVAIFLLFGLIVFAGLFGTLVVADPTLIARGVAIASVDVSGRSSEEAKRILREHLSGIRLTFTADEATAVVEAKAPLARFDVDGAVDRAFALGKETGAVAAVSTRIRASLFGATIPLGHSLDKDGLRKELDKSFAGKTSPARDAKLVIKLAADGAPSVAVAKEREGVVFDLDQAVKDAEARLRSFSADPVAVRVIKERPLLDAADVEPLVAGVAPAIARAPLSLTVKGASWTLSKQLIADWITALPGGKAGRPVLGLDPEKAGKFLASRGADLTVAPKDAVFKMEGGRVVAFEPSTVGEALDVPASIAAVEKALFAERTAGALELPFTEIVPAVDTASSNPYGIREIIGIGETNFKGSPKNRRHNIKVGAAALDGILVMPGEEFSLLKALGNINAAAGYLEELVIKGNKTTPEFGGGLCQIGSTTFRAVLDSGLPVTERRNHSYRVPYYERDGDGKFIGPGKDATIYDPAPDFKFINDTGNAILLRTAIKGDRLTFTFWGTGDGRVAEQTAAKVSNVIPPPEKKMIETTELPPGEIKCTEKPHPGSDAVFTYTVTYPNGEIKKKDFFSRYRPWGEVCLVGVDPSKQPTAGTDMALPSADATGVTGR
jgi:vancomycin resistance protein YoaR